MENIKQITQEIQPILDEYQVELYEINWIKTKRSTTLQIAIMNSDGTMDIETCANVSEKISNLLDEHSELDNEYMLEVCSPGAERKLRSIEEVQKAVEKKVYVKLHTEVKGFNEVTGTLQQFSDGELVIKYMDKAVARKLVVSYSNVKLIRLAV